MPDFRIISSSEHRRISDITGVRIVSEGPDRGEAEGDEAGPKPGTVAGTPSSARPLVTLSLLLSGLFTSLPGDGGSDRSTSTRSIFKSLYLNQQSKIEVKYRV